MEGQDGFPTWRKLSPLDRFCLGPGCRKLGSAHGFSGTLAGEIDFQPRIQGYHVPIPGDDLRFVGKGTPTEHHPWVIIQEIIEFLRPVGKGTEGNPFQESFPAVIHGSAPDQIHQAVAEQAGMDAQMVPILQGFRHSAGDMSHPQLEGGSVRDQFCYVGRDFPIQVTHAGQGRNRCSPVRFHKGSHLGNGQQGISPGPGKMGAHFQQYQGSSIDDIPFEERTEEKGKITVGIHGRSRSQQYWTPMQGRRPLEGLPDQAGGPGRQKAAQPFGMGFPSGRAEEPGNMFQGLPHGRIMLPGQIRHGHTGVISDALPAPLSQ